MKFSIAVYWTAYNTALYNVPIYVNWSWRCLLTSDRENHCGNDHSRDEYLCKVSSEISLLVARYLYKNFKHSVPFLDRSKKTVLLWPGACIIIIPRTVQKCSKSKTCYVLFGMFWQDSVLFFLFGSFCSLHSHLHVLICMTVFVFAACQLMRNIYTHIFIHTKCSNKKKQQNK